MAQKTKLMSSPLSEPAAVRPNAVIGASGWVVLLVALAVRGGVFFVAGDALHSDPDGYRALAENLVEFGVFGHEQQPTAYRPPLYPLLLAPCVAIGSDATARAAIALLHVVLGVATTLLTLWLGVRWGLGRYAELAAALVAFDPLLLNQSTLVMTETLAACLACAALAALTRAAERPTVGRAAMAGVCLGLAALCRPTFFAWSALVFVGWGSRVSDGRQRWLTLGATAIGCSIIVAPWAVRNAEQFDRPIISTTHGGYTLLLANNPSYYAFLQTAARGEVWRAEQFDRQTLAARRAAADDEVSADRRERAQAWQTIRDQPRVFLKACLVRVGHFWGLLPHRTAGETGLRRNALRYAAASWYFVEFALAVAGLWVLGNRLVHSPWLWAVLLAASLTAVHVLYWSDMRMRAPLMPVVALLAARGAAAFRDRSGGRKTSTDKDLKSPD